MIDVRAEGTDFSYLPRDAHVPEDVRISDAPGDLPPFLAERRQSAEDWRVARMSFHPRVPPAIYALHWMGAPDLDAIDRRVRDGSSTDDDFRDSIRTLFQRTRCFKCGRTWNTLIVPPEEYLGAPQLMQQKIQARTAARAFLSCPECHASLRQLVVKIFGEATAVPAEAL
ncbi:MAG TPA: hypothetical protein VF432_29650 [Thermoanaerobaculia bacterium]